MGSATVVRFEVRDICEKREEVDDFVVDTGPTRREEHEGVGILNNWRQPTLSLSNTNTASAHGAGQTPLPAPHGASNQQH